jgi:hypothetical protein
MREGVLVSAYSGIYSTYHGTKYTVFKISQVRSYCAHCKYTEMMAIPGTVMYVNRLVVVKH